MLHFFSQHLHHRLLVILDLVAVFGLEVFNVRDVLSLLVVVEGALGVHLKFDVLDPVDLQVAVFHQD